MIARPRFRCRTIAVAALTCSLAGCGTVNEKLSAGVADTLPQWAGGLPAGAPPRPGTAEYDQYMKERERRRQQPASERTPDGKPGAAASSSPR